MLTTSGTHEESAIVAQSAKATAALTGHIKNDLHPGAIIGQPNRGRNQTHSSWRRVRFLFRWRPAAAKRLKQPDGGEEPGQLDLRQSVVGHEQCLLDLQ
jgi:hypothetical protein